MTLRWNVSELLASKEEGVTFKETVSVQEITERDPEIRKVSPVVIHGFVEFDKKVITFHLDIEGYMVLPCSITLEDVKYPFRIQTIEGFRLSSTYIEEPDDDIELHDVEDKMIDLYPYVLDAILVEKPISVISDKAKQEPLPSGEGWVVVTEEEQKQRVDPRFDELKKFFED